MTQLCAIRKGACIRVSNNTHQFDSRPSKGLSRKRVTEARSFPPSHPASLVGIRDLWPIGCHESVEREKTRTRW